MSLSQTRGSGSVRLGVIIPVYNHGLTVRRVAREAKAHCPVIVVNDGSTDETPAALEQEGGIEVVSFPQNRGKAEALKAGFSRARELGWTHAITMDADGQHSAAELPRFMDACRKAPEAFVIGVRDFKIAHAPLRRRISNAISNFWFKFETGIALGDTQCGFRAYPLEPLLPLRINAPGYAYELEVMVKAAWAGLHLLPVPVSADYEAPTSRMSHFRPLRDFMRVGKVHSLLSMEAFCIPAPLRRLWVNGLLRGMPKGRRIRTVLGHLYGEHTETSGRLAAAVGVGLFCGIAPIWGAQMLAAALLAHKLRLNKAIALTASNISFPLAAPFIMAASLVLGNFLWTGEWMEFNSGFAARRVPLYFVEWVIGSVALGLIAGLLGACAAFATSWYLRRSNGPATRAVQQ